MKTALLIIDAQYDFCSPDGSLFVPGAEDDVKRIASLISRHAEQIDSIFVTLDTHHILDIAHPLFWEDKEGFTVAPFTMITSESVENGRFRPRYNPDLVQSYLQALEAQGEFKHFIWPEHCLIGSRGAALDETVSRAIMSWSHQNQKDYIAIQKGLNPLTEHFGVFKAQVPVAEDPSTSLNADLISELREFGNIWVVGEARSHCVVTSIGQLVQFAPDLVPRISILTDCMSDVPNFGHLADPVFVQAKAAGAQFLLSGQLKTF